LRIAELTYTEMLEHGSPSMNQDSGFILNSTCWNCGGEGHKADECPSKKTSASNPFGSYPNKVRGKWSAPRNGEPDMKTINGNCSTKRWDKQSEESATGTFQVLLQRWLSSRFLKTIILNLQLV